MPSLLLPQSQCLVPRSIRAAYLLRDEGLGVLLVSVRVTEDDLGERSTSTGVVDDLLHHSSHVTMSLSLK